MEDKSFVVTLDSEQVNGHSYLDFITVQHTSFNTLHFLLFILLTASCIFELMGLTETIEQSNEQQLCIHMCSMEQRKERTYINVLLCLFLSFFFFLYMWLPSIRWYIHISTYTQREYRRTFIFTQISFLSQLSNLTINDYSSSY